MNFATSATLSSLAVVFISSASHAAIAFNNFTEEHDGFGYDHGLGWTIAGPNNGNGQYGVEQAMEFSPEASGVLTDLWVPIWQVPFSTPADEVTIRLTTSTGAFPDAETVLEEWTLNDFPGWSSWAEPHHLTSNSGVVIDENASYWLWFEGGDTTWCGWCIVSDPSDTLNSTLRRDGEDWLTPGQSTAGAFRMDVAIPSPAGLALFATAGLLGRRRRR